MVDPSAPGAPRFYFTERRTFYWKVALLAATTVALIPVLLLKNTEWAAWYLWALAAVHVGGVVVVVVGVKRAQIAPDRRGLAIRLVAIALLVALLWLVSKGLTNPALDLVFWASLFAIWALHTAGLALLHIRGRREATVCPFV
jgi:hypothetical protein